MTPVQLLRQYQKLWVVFPDPSKSTDSEIVFSDAQIKVKTYISNAGNPCAKKVREAGGAVKTRTEAEIKLCTDDRKNRKKLEAFDRAQKRLGEKNRTLQPDAPAADKSAVAMAFYGKGSPDDIALARPLRTQPIVDPGLLQQMARTRLQRTHPRLLWRADIKRTCSLPARWNATGRPGRHSDG